MVGASVASILIVYTGACIIANIANGFTFKKKYENQCFHHLEKSQVVTVRGVTRAGDESGQNRGCGGWKSGIPGA
jgi:hypothetical protein